MAASTAVSGARPKHRTARLGDNGFPHALALDWANGQAIALSGASAQSAVFDAANDRVVMVSVYSANAVAGEALIAVGLNPTATNGAGSMAVSAPVAIYVPAGMLIAGLQGPSGSTLLMIPALLAGD